MIFLTPLVTQKHKEPGEFIIFRDFRVLCSMPGDVPAVISIPRGFITDFASVPRLVQVLPGFNRTESSANAAVLHDWLYCNRGEVSGVHPVLGLANNKHKLTRKQCDQLLYEGLRASGYSSVTAWMFYSAVRAGGWLYWNRRSDGLDLSYDFVADDFDWEAS